MNVLVVGANGKIGRSIVALLVKSKKHEVTALIRDPQQASDLERLGARTQIADLEKDISGTAAHQDAVIFTAGSGPHTGADKTLLVDLDGAFKTVDEAAAQNVRRFIMVSAYFADDPSKGSEKIRHYNVAKQRADERLQNSNLNYTIIRPGRLTEDAGTGNIAAAKQFNDPEERQIPREDVAQTVVAALDIEQTYQRSFKILTGDTPINDALTSLT